MPGFQLVWAISAYDFIIFLRAQVLSVQASKYVYSLHRLSWLLIFDTHLGREAREKLKLKVENALYSVQEQQSKVRSKAPRYSFNVNPKIFEDEGESLKQDFKPDTPENQPAALKFYKNIRTEVLETAEQLKNLKVTALRVAGIEKQGEENIDNVVSPQNSDSTSNNTSISNSTMRMKKRRASAPGVTVQDTSGHQIVEETTKAWIKNQYRRQTLGMESHTLAMESRSTPQALTGWQQNQQPGLRPSATSFESPQSFAPPAVRFPEPILPTQSIAGRPTTQRLELAQSSRQAFSSGGFQQQMGSMPLPPLAVRSTSQPSLRPTPHNFSPRGFQQQMGSMPLPPAPSPSALLPAQHPVAFQEGTRPFPQAAGVNRPTAFVAGNRQQILSPPTGRLLPTSTPARIPTGAMPQLRMETSGQPFPAQAMPRGMRFTPTQMPVEAAMPLQADTDRQNFIRPPFETGHYRPFR